VPPTKKSENDKEGCIDWDAAWSLHIADRYWYVSPQALYGRSAEGFRTDMKLEGIPLMTVLVEESELIYTGDEFVLTDRRSCLTCALGQEPSWCYVFGYFRGVSHLSGLAPGNTFVRRYHFSTLHP